MAYRIEYGGSEFSNNRECFLLRRAFLLSCVTFAIFAVCIRMYWPEGWEILQMILFPGDITSVQNGVEEFVAAVREGNDLSDAVMTFCKAVISDE